MFKKHRFNPPSSFIDFFHLIARRNEWTLLLLTPKKPIVTVSGSGDKISFNAEGFVHLEGKEPVNIRTNIEIIPHKRIKGVYLVSKFGVEVLKDIKGVHIISWGEEVLRHYGKHYAEENDDTRPLDGSLWEIRCPANLEALLRAYDNLARLDDCITIFNLP